MNFAELNQKVNRPVNSLKLYSYLESLPTRLSYSSKLMGVTVICAVVQWAALASWVFSGLMLKDPVLSCGILVASSALMTGVSCWAIWSLLKPVQLVVQFMDKYAANGEITDLPQEFQDEAGRLMRHARTTVLNHDRSLREVKHASKMDSLTGLYNRKFSSERLQQDLARANRSLMPVSIIVADIDGFKKINDAYGNAVGDACLQHFATVAQSSIRDGDWIGRWGADEFLVVLWGADSEIAEAVIWRIKRNIGASDLAHEAGIRLSASYGYATHLPGELDFEFVHKADCAMENAKRQGRNRVWGESMASR